MIFFLFGIQENLETVGDSVSEEKEMLHALLVSFAHLVYMRARFETIRLRREQQEENTVPS